MKKVDIFDRLYKSPKDSKHSRYTDSVNQELEQCTFKPKINKVASEK